MRLVSRAVGFIAPHVLGLEEEAAGEGRLVGGERVVAVEIDQLVVFGKLAKLCRLAILDRLDHGLNLLILCGDDNFKKKYIDSAFE